MRKLTLAMTLAVAAGCSNSPTSVTMPPRASATGVWTGWVRIDVVDTSAMICGGSHTPSDLSLPARFDLVDNGGSVTGTALLDPEFTDGPQLTGTYSGSSLRLTVPANTTDCAELECSEGPSHFLCLSGGSFDGTVQNVDSWQGTWSLQLADTVGTVTFSGAFRADR